MSNFGENNEASDGFVRKLYTGVENFKILSINPTHEELKKLYGENAKEDSYIITNDKNETQLKIVLHCASEAEEKEDEIRTRITYWVSKSGMKSNDGSKLQVINMYGKTAWLTQEELDAKQAIYDIGNKGKYLFEGDGVRPCLRGEPEFINMLRNLLNLPSPEKAEDKSKAASQFSMKDWESMFGGNFTLLNNIIKKTSNKVGFLLGVKRVEDKIYQDAYTRSTLRQYGKNSGKFEYLINDMQEAQANGAYPKTDFGNLDCKLRLVNTDAAPTNKEELIADKPAGSSFFDEDTSDSFL